MTRRIHTTGADHWTRPAPRRDYERHHRDGPMDMEELYAAELRSMPWLTLACVLLGMVVTVAAAAVS